MAVMNRTTRPLLPPLAAFLLAALCLLSPRPVDALSVSKSLPLYARDMEFYYQNKRPEVLPGILRSFDGQGVLAQGEKRLMVAAFLAEVLRRVKAKGAEFVLDISSHQLADLIAMEPLLIKPNDDELLDIFGIKVSGGDDESVKGAMAELHAKGAKNVLLTLGGAGAYFSNGEHIWFANRTFDVKLLSTVCAGDSSLAAFLSVWHDAPERVEDALRLSMATGANVVECPGLGDFAKVDEYKKHIEVRQVC